jgi:mono/diheme cytochrome c family protein
VEKLCVQAGISLACTLLTVACLGVVVYAAESRGLLDPLLHGREIFEQNCIMCHGADAKGTGQLAAALPVRPANLTDCKLTAEDSVEVLQGIIRHGGPYAGRSPVMPAFETVLSNSDIADLAHYVKSLCADPDWVPEELNFPRPLITGKAFPEQEMLVGGRFGRNGEKVNEYLGVLDYRVNGLTNIEIKSRALSINPNIGPTESGVGDTVLSVKRVVAFSPLYRTLASAGVELTLPTGSDQRGLGDGNFVLEPNLRAGVDWKQFVVQVAGALAFPARTSDINSEGKLDVAIGRYFFPDPRLQITPMIEFNTTTRISGPSYGETKSAILPQVRVKWLVWSLGVGAQAPITRARDFAVRPLFDLVYEYAF